MQSDWAQFWNSIPANSRYHLVTTKGALLIRETYPSNVHLRLVQDSLYGFSLFVFQRSRSGLDPELNLAQEFLNLVPHVRSGRPVLALCDDGETVPSNVHDPTQLQLRPCLVQRLMSVFPVVAIADAEYLELVISRNPVCVALANALGDRCIAGADQVARHPVGRAPLLASIYVLWHRL